ncbi:MAG: glycosyltransferase [Alphaproteobacteria bacterium]|nr:glycosyltransferase [Alphaproteobacteria bacterium]
MKNNTPLRVAFVLPSLTAGGAERVLITLMNGLPRAEFSPAMICVNDGGPLRDLIATDIDFTALYKSERMVSPEKSLPALYRALRAIKPDIVVATMAQMNFAVLVLRPLFPKTQFIVREAITPSFILEKRARAAPVIRAAYKRLYPLAACVISPAQMIIDEFSSVLKMDVTRHICLPNPVDADKIRGDGVAHIPDVPPNTIRFIAAGRLHSQKGFDRLLDSLPALAGDWHLTILGEGPERSALEAQIRNLGLESRVSLVGLVDKPWPYYAAADAFLLPSRWEGLPNVALESLCCGTPVIAMYEAGGIGEIAAAAPQAVVVCRSMTEFIERMGCVQTDNATHYRPSLLPALYERSAVIEKFTQILRRVAGRPA